MLHRIKKKNDIHEGKWNGLGGKMENGESPDECIIREVYEESGLRIKNPIMKGLITEPKFDGVNDMYVFIFVARDFEGELIDSVEGKLEWIDDDKLSDLNLWETDKKFINRLDEDIFFSYKQVWKEGKLVDSKFISY